jgi:hypothetical protein
VPPQAAAEDSYSRAQKRTRSKAVTAGDNAQIAVDGAYQIIVARHLHTSPADARALPVTCNRYCCTPIPKKFLRTPATATRKTSAISAAAGLMAVSLRDGARHGQKHAAGSRQWPKGSCKAAMAMKLKRVGRHSRYRLRKQIGEPVFGQIKRAGGFRQFLLCGLNKVRG